METGQREAAAVLAIAILENRSELPNHRPAILKGKHYQDRLIEIYFEVLEKIRTP